MEAQPAVTEGQAPASVSTPAERNDTGTASPFVNANAPAVVIDIASAVGAVAAPTMAARGGRFTPLQTLAEVTATRGAFGSRGGRQLSRGRGASSAPANVIENAPPSTSSIVTFPVLPTTISPPSQQQSILPPQQQQQRQQQQQPQQQQPPQQRSFADVAKQPLQSFGRIPLSITSKMGWAPDVDLPQLPKENAHAYSVDVPFVSRASRNFDTVEGYLGEETGFKLTAIRHASRVLIVRTTVVTDQPYIFLWDVLPQPPVGLMSSRITLKTIEPKSDIAIEGLEAPKVQDDSVLYLLQGPMHALRRLASNVVIRSVIGGKSDDERIYDAVGLPLAGWEKELTGAPLHLVQEWKHAGRRATVKLAFDKTSTLVKRWHECGEFAAAFREHVVGCYLSGYNIRVVLKQAFSYEYKRYFGTCPAVASVYTDIKPPPTPVRVQQDQPTPHEMDIAALTVEPNEVALHGGLCTSAAPPTNLFQILADKMKIRLIAQNGCMCVFAVDKRRVGDLVGRTLAGWVSLAEERHG